MIIQSKTRAWIVMQLFALAIFVQGIINAEGFVAGTLVKVPAGYAAIETLRIGDVVCSVNQAGKQEEQVVLGTYQFQEQTQTVVFVNNKKIIASRDQQVVCCSDPATVNTAWVRIGDYKKSAELGCSEHDGVALIPVNAAQLKRLAEPVVFYALAVSGNSNYCVSESNLVVHNFAISLTVLSIGFGSGISIATAGIGAIALAVVATLICSHLEEKYPGCTQGFEGNANAGRPMVQLYDSEQKKDPRRNIREMPHDNSSVPIGAASRQEKKEEQKQGDKETGIIVPRRLSLMPQEVQDYFAGNDLLPALFDATTLFTQGKIDNVKQLTVAELGFNPDDKFAYICNDGQQKKAAWYGDSFYQDMQSIGHYLQAEALLPTTIPIGDGNLVISHDGKAVFVDGTISPVLGLASCDVAMTTHPPAVYKTKECGLPDSVKWFGVCLANSLQNKAQQVLENPLATGLLLLCPEYGLVLLVTSVCMHPEQYNQLFKNFCALWEKDRVKALAELTAFGLEATLFHKASQASYKLTAPLRSGMVELGENLAQSLEQQGLRAVAHDSMRLSEQQAAILVHDAVVSAIPPEASAVAGVLALQKAAPVEIQKTASQVEEPLRQIDCSLEMLNMAMQPYSKVEQSAPSDVIGSRQYVAPPLLHELYQEKLITSSQQSRQAVSLTQVMMPTSVDRHAPAGLRVEQLHAEIVQGQASHSSDQEDSLPMPELPPEEPEDPDGDKENKTQENQEQGVTGKDLIQEKDFVDVDLPLPEAGDVQAKIKYWQAEWEAGVQEWQKAEFVPKNPLKHDTPVRIYSYRSRICGSNEEIELFFQFFEKEANFFGQKIPFYKNKKVSQQIGWKWEKMVASESLNEELIVQYEYRWLCHKEKLQNKNANFVKSIIKQNKIVKPGELKTLYQEKINFHIYEES